LKLEPRSVGVERLELLCWRLQPSLEPSEQRGQPAQPARTRAEGPPEVETGRGEDGEEDRGARRSVGRVAPRLAEVVVRQRPPAVSG
jgi:hypothetical protein